MIQSPTRLKNTSQTTTHHCLVARAAAHPQAIRACIRPRRARRATGATCVSLTLANIDVLQQRKNAVCVALRNARQLGDLQFRCLGWPAHALLAQAAVARLTSRRSLARTLVVAALRFAAHGGTPPARARTAPHRIGAARRGARAATARARLRTLCARTAVRVVAPRVQLPHSCSQSSVFASWQYISLY